MRVLTLYTDQGTMSNIFACPFLFLLRSASRSRSAHSVFSLSYFVYFRRRQFESFSFVRFSLHSHFTHFPAITSFFSFPSLFFSTFFSLFFIILPVLFPATSYSSSPSDFLTFPSFPIHYPLPLPAVSSFFLPSLCRPFLSLGKLGGRFRCWARLGYGIAYSF